MMIRFDPQGVSSNFTIGPENYSISWPGQPWPCELKISRDSRDRLVLGAGDREITFGPIQKWWDDPAKPEYQFVPETGDVVLFVREIGRAPWATPFTFNVLGGAVAKWKRHVYDRLRWTKADGSRLEIVWRNEYWFYRGSGWTDCYMNRLERVRIRK